MNDESWPRPAPHAGPSRQGARKHGRGFERWLSPFPVFLVSWTLIWIGAIGVAGRIAFGAHTAADTLIPPHSALHLVLTGMALLMASRRPAFALALALASVFPPVYGYAQASVDADFPPAHLLQASVGWTITSILLSLAIAGAAFVRRGLPAARLLALTVIVCAVVLRLFSFPSLGGNADDAGAANLAMVLGVLSGCAALALTFRRKPADPGPGRAVAILGIAGALIGVSGWYLMADADRHLAMRHAVAVGERPAYVVENTIQRQMTGIIRTAEKWSQPAVQPTAFIDREIASHLEEVRALEAILLLDDHGTVRRIAGDPSAQDWIVQASQGPDLLARLGLVHVTGDTHFVSQDADGSPRVRALAAATLTGGPSAGWAVLAVYDLRELLRESLEAPAGTRAWPHPFPGPLPELILLICLALTFFLTRSQRLALALRKQSAQLCYDSRHDASTGLPNKQYLMLRLGEAFRNHPPEKGPAVVLLDLHGLKLINDSMGHDVGDEMLVLVAARLKAALRSDDFVARMDGDEFVILLHDTPVSAVIGIVERIIASVARPYSLRGTELRLSSNAGIASRDKGTESPAQLMREADLAITRARREGRNTWQQYSGDLGAPVSERLALRNELQAAIENDELTLHYQPVVERHAGRLSGVEALLRWPHPQRENVTPSMFIPLAEETGLIIPLSLWALDRACRDIATLRQRNGCDFPVMVNISPSHFLRSDFVKTVDHALQKHDVPAQYLEIEITEGVLLENTSEVIAKLHELKGLGVSISLDDFGTGYSSLSYLKNLPIDKLKIDRSFVNEVASDRHDAAITKSIISLAHHLDIRVVAEGVETEPQYWFLKRNFCDEFQGFLFSRPVPLEELMRRLQERGNHVALPPTPWQRPSDRTLLLVDDEENILRALTRVLHRDGYRILTARTPREAFSLLAANNVQVIVSDQRMPEMTGTEFFSHIKEMYPGTVRLVLSGYTDLKSVTEAINRGAIYRYLTKPWDDQELRSEIAQAFQGVSTRGAGASPAC